MSLGSHQVNDDGARALFGGAPFYRAHGLGNDYLVFEAAESLEGGWHLTPEVIRRLCHRGEGVGSDGIVVLVDRAPADGVFPLRMFNPDGSEFERSGNGLRILASHLHREGLVGTEPFRVRTGGAELTMTVHGVAPGGRFDVSVAMGTARTGAESGTFDLGRVGARTVIEHPTLGPIQFVAVSVGNPHAVVFREEVGSERSGADLLAEAGAFLATHPAFPQGTNVQVAQIEGPGRLRIWIWERGVGRTSASGTSACAAAVAAVSTGRLDPGPIELSMDGGRLEVTVDGGLDVVLRGPVFEVAEGRLTSGFLEALRNPV